MYIYLFALQTNDTSIIYTNIVRYAVPYDSSVITRTQVYFITVYCVIPRVIDPGNNFDTNSRSPPPSGGGGQYTVALNFYKTNKFQVNYTIKVRH